MKLYVLRTLLVIGICFAFSFTLVGCDNLIGSEDNNSNNENPPDTDNSNNDPVDENEADIPRSPGGPLPGATLREKLNAVSQRADQNVYYDIAIQANGAFDPLTVRTGGKNVAVRIYSEPPNQYTLTLGSSGSLFTVGDSTTLILENVVLKGQPGNNSALLKVEGGGTLIIEDGAIIRDNENTNNADTQVNSTSFYSEGGGVNVGQKGRLIMNGGQICYNSRVHTSKYVGHGGGVVIDKDGYFNMTGGSIHNNEANSLGGGVAVFFGYFLMNGGEIASNTAWYGGGVYAISKNLFYYSLTWTFVKEPLPGKLTSGIIWGYPANNSKENYANGPAVWYDWDEGYYCVYRESTLGEYHAISTLYVWLHNSSSTIDPNSGWEYRAN